MGNFHDKIEELGDTFVVEVYQLSKKFPSDERFGLTQQLRRAAVSIMLNYAEGRAKRSDGNYGNHMMIAYGSLKEAQYGLRLAVKLEYLKTQEIQKSKEVGDELGAMLFTLIRDLKNLNTNQS